MHCDESSSESLRVWDITVRTCWYYTPLTFSFRYSPNSALDGLLSIEDIYRWTVKVYVYIITYFRNTDSDIRATRVQSPESRVSMYQAICIRTQFIIIRIKNLKRPGLLIYTIALRALCIMHYARDRECTWIMIDWWIVHIYYESCSQMSFDASKVQTTHIHGHFLLHASGPYIE